MPEKRFLDITLRLMATAIYESRMYTVAVIQISEEKLQFLSPYQFMAGRPILIEHKTEYGKVLRLPSIITGAIAKEAGRGEKSEYRCDAMYTNAPEADMARLRELLGERADRRTGNRSQTALASTLLHPRLIKGLTTTNVSDGGLFLATEIPIPLGTRLRLEQKLPENAGIVIDAMVMHFLDIIHASLIGKKAGLGLKIIGMDPNDSESWHFLRPRMSTTGAFKKAPSLTDCSPACG